MGETLKERLAKLPNSMTQTKDLACGLSVTIRRIKIGERNALIGQHQGADKDAMRGAAFSRDIVALALVDPQTTAEDLDDLPAMVVDEIAAVVMDFNGWSQKGKAELADSFRPSA